MDKAVILLAGTGSRMRPMTNGIPKALLSIDGRTLLDRALETLVRSGVRSFVLVTGYRAEQIHEHLVGRFLDASIEFIHNDRYESTNNAFSLLLVRQVVHGCGMILLDGDILFDPEILDGLLREKERSTLILRRCDDLEDEEMKVMVRDDGTVAAIGKDLPPSACAGESIGIERFTPEDARRLFEILEDRVMRGGYVSEFYEASFQQLIDEGTAIVAVDTGSAECIEIDTIEDFARAEARFSTTPHPRTSPPNPVRAHPTDRS